MVETSFEGRQIVKNLGFLFNGEIISQILNLLLVIVISRELGDVGMGKYSFVFSFASLFLILADFGIPTLITKEIAKNKKSTDEHITKTYTLKVILNSITLAVTLIVIYLLKKDKDTVLLVLLAGLAMLFYNLAGIFRSIFQAYGTMKYEVIAKLLERLIAVGLGIFLLTHGYGILSLFITLVLSNFFYYVVTYFFVAKKNSTPGFDFDVDQWKKVIKRSFPFWLTLIFVSFYVRIDTIMLGLMKDYASTGWYNAAYRIIDVFARVLFLPIIVLFPALSRFHTFSMEKTKILYEKAFYYIIVLALPIVCGIVFLADRIIMTIYGPQFQNSIIVLRILGTTLFFTSLNYLMGYLLNSIDKQKLFTLTTGIATVLNIVLNLIFIPKRGYLGAGIVTVISEIINFTMLYYFTSKNDFKINILKLLLKPFIASFVMLSLIYYFNNLHVIFLVLIGAVSYISVLFATKGIGIEEIRLIKSIVHK